MKPLSLILTIGISLLSIPGGAEVYKSIAPGGSVTYSDIPSNNASKLNVPSSKVTNSAKSLISHSPIDSNDENLNTYIPTANDVNLVQPQPVKVSGQPAVSGAKGGSVGASGGGTAGTGGGNASSSGNGTKLSPAGVSNPQLAVASTPTSNTPTSNTPTSNTPTSNTPTSNTPIVDINPIPEQPHVDAELLAVQANRLLEIISKDMVTENEGIPATGDKNYAWAYKPVLAMGLNPTSAGVPSWYPGTKFPVWNQVLGWVTAYREKGAEYPVNTRVALKDLYLYYFSKSKKSWILLEHIPAIQEWHRGEGNTENDNVRTSFNMRREADGSTSYLVPHGSWFHTYGYLHQFDVNDYGGLYFRFDFRLVTDDLSRPSTLNKDRWVVQSGADYYPSGFPNVNLGASYNPGVGTGRFLRAGPNWRTSTFLILAPEYELKKYPPNITGVYE